MKANELRIGNLFYTINRDVPKSIPHLPVLIPFEIAYFGMFDKVVSCKPQDNIAQIKNPLEVKFFDMSPIPLTEEWLLRFGFMDVGNDDFLISPPTWHIPCFKAGINKHKGLFSWANNVLAEIKIEYVHQLQNLFFALTGEELKIK